MKSKLSIDTRLAVKSGLNLHSRLLLNYFDMVEAMFTKQEADLIRGRLRMGDLSIANGPLVTQKLELARATGNLSTKDFRQLYQFASFFRKLPESGSETLCMENGYKKLLQGEESCKNVNSTIEARKGFNYPLFDRVQTIIYDILGDVPNDFLNTDIFFGPGSTVNVDERKFAETGTFFKITDKLVIPQRAKFYLAALLSNQPNWVDMLGTHYHDQHNASESRLQFEKRVFAKHFVIVDDDYPSKIGFVEKSAEEFRTIGVELNGLVPLQKVVGNLIRQRLYKRTKIDLNTQQRNKHLARLAQTFGLATIDLANASGSISLKLVKALLPSDWFAVISDFRSTHGQCNRLNRDPIAYEMVSSMGNGFTFELESLIFYAVAKATAEQSGIHDTESTKSITVFGDDIIVPARMASSLISNMSLMGFTTNTEKSFINGYFYESCGADYYDGTDVRPFFIKRNISSFRDLLFVMNSLMFKAISQGRSDFTTIYLGLFNEIPDTTLLGPLHINSKEFCHRNDDVVDDLEATLRVPLWFAQAMGGVQFNVLLSAWIYRKWIRVSVDAPISKSKCYHVKHAKYYTFLKGHLGGKVSLRGRSETRHRTDVTSQWDGTLTISQARIADALFQNIVENNLAAN